MQSTVNNIITKYPVLRYTNKNVVLRAINVGNDTMALAALDKVRSRPFFLFFLSFFVSLCYLRVMATTSLSSLSVRFVVVVVDVVCDVIFIYPLPSLSSTLLTPPLLPTEA
jgi:hypothetical protein